jgi:hypothetical protein
MFCESNSHFVLVDSTRPLTWIYTDQYQNPLKTSMNPLATYRNQFKSMKYRLSQSKPMKLILNFSCLHLQEISNTESSRLRPGRWPN